MERKKGLLLVISGPSGVGKGTVTRILFERHQNLQASVSATTRGMRAGEIEGVHYYFKTVEEFEKMIKEGTFLEYMQVFGMNYYGTPAGPVEEKRNEGIDVVLEIDVQGAMNVKKSCPDAVLIFIAPPEMEELKRRLKGRDTETEEVIQKRYNVAFEEMKLMPQYDYVVVNDEVEEAVASIESIIRAEKCRTARNTKLMDQLLGGMKL